jgi:hypothetical protein
MIQHIVFLSWKEGADDKAVEDALGSLSGLSGIYGVSDVHYGRNINQTSHRFTHAVTIKIRDRETLQIFAQHPLHVASIQKMDPLMADFISIDFELEAAPR